MKFHYERVVRRNYEDVNIFVICFGLQKKITSLSGSNQGLGSKAEVMLTSPTPSSFHTSTVRNL